MSMHGVRLGFEVDTGQPVEIPIHHTVITGQTQRAGKTTALEALIARSQLKAVAFVTKRGEGSFGDARTIAPYFREQADWKYVASILEASRGEKMKFERSWIIKVSRGARTLADVQKNVRTALRTAKGINEGVYTVLDAYLDDVVPLIDRVQWAKRVVLGPGLNVVDMTHLNVEMQHLVIRSTIEWVLEHEEGTIVIVPEAWKFIPQGRGTPVKLAAEAYIRQAAGLRNYLWLDSQDIAGVEKLILKSVPIWILGVQREANEVKRTLAQIPAGIKKPRTEDIATLGLGQFYACHGTHVTKTYVQPAWMNDAQARQVATGQLDVATASRLSPRPHYLPADRNDPVQPEEDDVKESEARELRATNERLERENAKLLKRVEELSRTVAAAADAVEVAPAKAKRGDRAPAPGDNGHVSEEMYQAIRARLVKDPVVLRVVATKPQLDVEVTREVITAKGDTLRGRVAGLIATGYFAEGVTGVTVQKELARRGKDPGPGNTYAELDRLAEMGFLTIEQGWDDRQRPRKEYRAVPEMKVNIREERA